MEAHLPGSEEARLLDLAARTGRGADDLVKEAVAKLLDYDDWFSRPVQIGMDQIARGEFFEEEQMDALVERMPQN
jgi:predicted transcriptional regulator